MTDPKTLWPPRGFIFTTRSHSAIGRAIVMGQRLRAWFPAQGHDEFSHAGIIDAYPMVWEAHARWGVIRRAIGRRSHLRFWHPPHEERLTPEDYARAFNVLGVHLGRPYDWRWIVSLGRFERPASDICTELVKIYLDELTRNIGGWAGMSLQQFVPNHISSYLNEVSIGRGEK